MKIKETKKEKLQKFITAVENDDGLRERLQLAVDNYVGDKTDMNGVVNNTVIPIAAEMGYKFSAGEYVEYLRNEVDRRLANTTVSDDDLFAVSGGIDTVDMQRSGAGGDVTIVDQHVEHTTININIILTPDSSPETLAALGRALSGH